MVPISSICNGNCLLAGDGQAPFISDVDFNRPWHDINDWYSNLGSYHFRSNRRAAFAGWRKNRANVVAATAFVVPFGLFFPFQSSADFFGQWNNIFMWSAVALALAAGRTLVPHKPKPKQSFV